MEPICAAVAGPPSPIDELPATVWMVKAGTSAAGKAGTQTNTSHAHQLLLMPS
jgi:hypothetical protein